MPDQRTGQYAGLPRPPAISGWDCGTVSFAITLLAAFLGGVNVQMYEVHNDGRMYNLLLSRVQ
jgi:hypothetical protein